MTVDLPITFLIFGAPKNKDGFKYCVYSPDNTITRPSIRDISKYIDIYSTKHGGAPLSVLRKVQIGKKSFLFIGEYEAVIPSDQSTSRGAYIGAGALIIDRIDITSHLAVRLKLSYIIDKLRTYRNNNNSFDVNFNIENQVELLKHSDSYIYLSLYTVAFSSDRLSKELLILNRENYPKKEVLQFLPKESPQSTKLKKLEKRCHKLESEIVRQRKEADSLQKQYAAQYNEQQDKFRELLNKYNKINHRYNKPAPVNRKWRYSRFLTGSLVSKKSGKTTNEKKKFTNHVVLSMLVLTLCTIIVVGYFIVTNLFPDSDTTNNGDTTKQIESTKNKINNDNSVTDNQNSNATNNNNNTPHTHEINNGRITNAILLERAKIKGGEAE